MVCLARLIPVAFHHRALLANDLVEFVAVAARHAETGVIRIVEVVRAVFIVIRIAKHGGLRSAATSYCAFQP